jgi:F-type H+-transporting ATPase subunit delta
MERATLARPYAEAIAKLAGESASWGLWSEQLNLLAQVAADEQLKMLINNPAIASSKIAEILLAVCGDKFGVEPANLTRLLAENKRLVLLPEIVDLFESLKSEQEGELTAHFTSAFEMSAEQVAALVAKLQVKLGRKITATQSVEPDLIGGVVIQVGDEVMDASVRGGLEALAVTLKA